MSEKVTIELTEHEYIVVHDVMAKKVKELTKKVDKASTRRVENALLLASAVSAVLSLEKGCPNHLRSAVDAEPDGESASGEAEG